MSDVKPFNMVYFLKEMAGIGALVLELSITVVGLNLRYVHVHFTMLYFWCVS